MTTIKTLDPGEFDHLLAECCKPRDRLGIALMYDAALRVGDVVDLRVKDLDLDRLLMRVWGGKWRKLNEYDTLPITSRVMRLTCEYLPDRVEGLTLLTTREGRPMRRAHWNRLLERLGERSLGKHVHPHMLRHTVLTELACDHGVPLPKVQAFARHKRLDTTARYLHVRPGWADDVRGALEQ